MLRSPLFRDTIQFLRTLAHEDFFGWGATVLPSFGMAFPSDMTRDRSALGLLYRNHLLNSEGEATPMLHRLFNRLFDKSQAPLDAQYAACVILRYVAVHHLFSQPENTP
jgi:hypothetical protein